jgi:GntR family L-lactate dehydrogenase operon transcriptional regulator
LADRSEQSYVQEAVLAALEEAGQPTGASVVHGRLLDLGFTLSEPTVGRMLREFDRQGLARPVGRLGRVLTTAGRSRLQELQDARNRDKNTNHLMDSLRAETLEDIINVLLARRGIERELARAAALKATAADIAALQAHDERMRVGETGDAEEGLHTLLAPAAHNPVLASVYRVITRDPRIIRLLNHVLIADRGMSSDFAFNARLIEAIVNRDSDAAEAAVVEHLDAVISTVGEVWASVKRNSARGGRGKHDRQERASEAS